MEGKRVYRPRYCFRGGIRALLTNNDKPSTSFEVREGLWNETDAGAVPLRGARVPCYD